MASAAAVDAGDAPDPTVRNLLDQESLKWVFVGGKGGVGKTTCSSILSVLLAGVRQSVLVISTDPAHNLSDAFQQRFTKFPTLVRGFTNLYAMEIDPKVENDDLSNEGMEGFLSELTNAIPGVDEAMSFAEMLKLVQTMDYSVVVFDTAPTGHTLRLLQFPATLEKGLEKMMELKNRFGGLLNQASRLFGLGDELNEDAMLGKLEGMKDVIEQVNRQFKDPTSTAPARSGRHPMAASSFPSLAPLPPARARGPRRPARTRTGAPTPAARGSGLASGGSGCGSGEVPWWVGARPHPRHRQAGAWLPPLTAAAGELPPYSCVAASTVTPAGDQPPSDGCGLDDLDANTVERKKMDCGGADRRGTLDLTTFVCVCIPEFLSLYETERLVQELAKFEIDSHNIIINQVIFDEEAVESKLLKARIKMQQKYIDQFHMLYDDFNITKLPLLSEEVCGVQALQNFSQHFLTPYKSALKRGTVEELKERITLLKSALQEAEAELDRVRKGKQSA